MKISEIHPGMTSVNFKAKVKDIAPIREVKTRYGKQKVTNATVFDDSGELKLTLWGKQIEKVKVGDIVEVTNGYVREWNGEIQVSVGKMGELKVNEM